MEEVSEPEDDVVVFGLVPAAAHPLELRTPDVLIAASP